LAKSKNHEASNLLITSLKIWLIVNFESFPDAISENSGASKKHEFALLECINIAF
jgi:hypothetical protein